MCCSLGLGFAVVCMDTGIATVVIVPSAQPNNDNSNTSRHGMR